MVEEPEFCEDSAAWFINGGALEYRLVLRQDLRGSSPSNGLPCECDDRRFTRLTILLRIDRREVPGNELERFEMLGSETAIELSGTRASALVDTVC